MTAYTFIAHFTVPADLTEDDEIGVGCALEAELQRQIAPLGGTIHEHPRPEILKHLDQPA